MSTRLTCTRDELSQAYAGAKIAIEAIGAVSPPETSSQFESRGALNLRFLIAEAKAGNLPATELSPSLNPFSELGVISICDLRNEFLDIHIEASSWAAAMRKQGLSIPQFPDATAEPGILWEIGDIFKTGAGTLAGVAVAGLAIVIGYYVIKAQK